MATRTARQMAGAQKRTLKAMQAKLLDMSADWDEVDQFLMGELNDLREKIGQIMKAMSEVSESAGS
ncbi:hypothetical protein [Vogesella sp. XCS3]|uniref:hypothetical protein n=1 Tax=Vogesella sp. XCS3 TaxID=2877939 RepID=UPI001D0BBC5B|nr:hypothetical protein [Vogesella sp. XCS3]UDM18968.1 hypothetical protein LCH97_18155 [Vogesella sp. XCS3]